MHANHLHIVPYLSNNLVFILVIIKEQLIFPRSVENEYAFSSYKILVLVWILNKSVQTPNSIFRLWWLIRASRSWCRIPFSDIGRWSKFEMRTRATSAFNTFAKGRSSLAEGTKCESWSSSRRVPAKCCGESSKRRQCGEIRGHFWSIRRPRWSTGRPRCLLLSRRLCESQKKAQDKRLYSCTKKD